MPHEFRSLIRQNAMVTELAGKTNPREIELLAGERKSDAVADQRFLRHLRAEIAARQQPLRADRDYRSRFSR